VGSPLHIIYRRSGRFDGSRAAGLSHRDGRL